MRKPSKHKRDLKEKLFKKYNHDISEMNKNINSIKSNLLKMNHSEELINNELKYAFVFNDTIKNSTNKDEQKNAMEKKDK